MMRYKWFRILLAAVMTSTVVTYKAHATGIEAIFDRHLETSSAGIFFHNRDEVHARRVLEILELATQLVAQRLPHSIEKVTAYLYGSDDEMAQGLTTTLGYTPMEVKAVLKVGISEQSNNTLHLHPKTAKWGSVLSHVIVDEHTHGVIQNKYGTGPARSATWIEEGLTSYLAHEVLADTLEDFEDTYPERRFKIAFKALIFGKLPALADVSTRNQWYSNINESDDAWNNEYALAYFSVSHIASNYGFESILNILSDVKKGLPYKDSLERVTGITLADFEHNMRVSLFYTGIFHLYIKYTVLILLSLTVIFLISVYCIREIRRRNRMGAEA